MAEIISNAIILILLVAVVALIIRAMIKDKKSGKSCSCGCADCPMSGSCGSGKNKEEN